MLKGHKRIRSSELRPLKALAALSFCASMALWGLGATAAAQNKARLSLDWLPSPFHANFYGGVKKGFFKAEGIDVEFISGRGSAAAVRNVGAGKAELGLASTIQTTIGRARKLSVLIVQMKMHRANESMFYVAGGKIRTPKDVEGKKVGFVGGGGLDKNFLAFAKIHNLNASTINLIAISPQVMSSQLLTGKIDGFITYSTVRGAFEGPARGKGQKIKWFNFSQMGLDLYGNGVISTEAVLKDNPRLVQGFVKAALRSTKWSIENPQEAVKLVTEALPAVNPNVAKTVFGEMAITFTDSITPKKGIGWVDPQKMARTVSFVNDFMEMPRKVNANEVYTNRFVEKTPKEWRFVK
ncbi:MAG: ABC transporter substrate-binding protein [Nitrospinota bacterium]